MWAQHTGGPLPPAEYFPPLKNRGRLLARVLAGSPDHPVLPYLRRVPVGVRVNAGRTIYLTSVYFTPDEEFLAALGEAAGRGIHVKIILPTFSDFWLPFYAGRVRYSRLVREGVEIYEM